MESKQTIVLHGVLADHLPAEYNGRFEAYFTTASDAAGMIECNFPGFYALIEEMSLHVVPKGDDTGLDAEQCIKFNIVSGELHIMPAVDGAGGGKGFMAVLGVVLIAVAVVVTGGAVIPGVAGWGAMSGFGAGSVGAWAAGVAFNAGVGMVLNSLVQPPQAPSSKGLNSEDNGIYTGPLNVSEEGACLPLVFGTIEVGGVVIHTDYDVATVRNDDYKDDS